MPWDVEPAELAALLDYAERPRTGDWSLRAALTRYAQPRPQQVGDLLQLVRRIEAATSSARTRIGEEGPRLWQAVRAEDPAKDQDRLVGLLAVLVRLDELGDVLAAWAADPGRERPDADVDAVVAEVDGRLEELGVPHEERRPPDRRRG